MLTAVAVSYANALTGTLLVQVAAACEAKTYESLAEKLGGPAWRVGAWRLGCWGGRGSCGQSAHGACIPPGTCRHRRRHPHAWAPLVPAPAVCIQPSPLPQKNECMQRFTQCWLVLLLFGTLCGDFALIADTGKLAVARTMGAAAPPWLVNDDGRLAMAVLALGLVLPLSCMRHIRKARRCSVSPSFSFFCAREGT